MVGQWYVTPPALRDNADARTTGMAVRLAVDLGLHLDPEPYVQMNLISAEEGMIRKVVWAGVFVHDRCVDSSRRRRMH